jgi:hypothetical protein
MNKKIHFSALSPASVGAPALTTGSAAIKMISPLLYDFFMFYCVMSLVGGYFKYCVGRRLLLLLCIIIHHC